MNSSNTYVLPVFPTGTGLGNRLFHWCDAKIYSYLTKSNFIAPLWCRPSLGKYIRGLRKGRIERTSLLEYRGAFRRLPQDFSYLNGIRRTLLSERICLSRSKLSSICHSPRSRLILFDKSSYHFNDYHAYRQRLKDDLISSIKPELVNSSLKSDHSYIGIHIRMGDGFKPPEPGANGFVRTGWLQQTPISWFQETLQLVRDVTGVNYKAYVISDGSNEQLKSLLAEDNVYRFESRNPVTDLLSLSNASVILGSGSSSFSAFAAFLGSAHSITAPGHPFSNRGLHSSNCQIITSLNPREDNAKLQLMQLSF